MSEKKFIDRLSRMVKILPQEQPPVDGNSWCDETKKVLSTEGKIHAIKMSERSRQPIVQKKKTPPAVVLRKWIKNCKWKLPTAILMFSVVQVREIECLILSVDIGSLKQFEHKNLR